MDSLPYVYNDHHAPLISHTPLYSPGPHSVLRLVSAELAGVGAGVDQLGGSSSSAVGCFTPRIQCVPLSARDPDEYSFLMTSDLSLGGRCVGACS
jgi:hypothetical protein